MSPGPISDSYQGPKDGRVPTWVGEMDSTEYLRVIAHLQAELAEYTKLKEYAASLGQRTYLELHAENEHWKNEWKKLDVENKLLRSENRILHAHSKRMRTACLMRAGYSISELEEMLAKATPPSPETER